MARKFLFYGLNFIRFISVVSLILVFAGSIYVMATDIVSVKHFRKESKRPGASPEDVLGGCDYIGNSTVPGQKGGIAWAVINWLFIIAQVTILAVSEVDLFPQLFDRFFPVVGPEFGLGPLGVFQCLIGGTVLSHHVRQFALVAGFFLFTIGCINILIGLILGVAAKTIRSGGMWESDSLVFLPSFTRKKSAPTLDDSVPGAAPGPSGSSGLGFGDKSGSLNGLSPPQTSPLPSYSPPRPHTLRSQNGSTIS